MRAYESKRKGGEERGCVCVEGGESRRGGKTSPREEGTESKKDSTAGRGREGEGEGGGEREGGRGDSGQKRREKTAPESDVGVLAARHQ